MAEFESDQGRVLFEYGRGYIFFSDSPHQVVPVAPFLGCDSQVKTKALGALCEEITEVGAYLVSSSLCCYCVASSVLYLDKL
ncbi:hypothetical protein DAEQUDRAFT_768483 [Daedalea quercina L-15889]|uniref:Uncharacterized protein n=1 Tax=Daedalea quercina L-15889 TaxID=1314783 RepID=A0A165MMD6_9APHY|nr:hypothetical protein DAEQUDRAFT_768483 [Daedalea quercina L-15889]